MSKTRALLAIILTLAGLAATARPRQAARSQNQWESAIKKFEVADQQNPPPQGAVLFVGSSSILFWKDLAADFPSTKVINRGFGGSQIADSTYYTDRIVIPYHPRMVVFYAGDNDLALGKTPQQVFEDYKGFVDRVRQGLPEVKIAFISIKPSLARVGLMDKMKEANALIRNYASAGKNLVYIDVFSPMLAEDGRPRPALFGPDGLHMNRQGYTLWRGIVAPYLR